MTYFLRMRSSIDNYVNGTAILHGATFHFYLIDFTLILRENKDFCTH